MSENFALINALDFQVKRATFAACRATSSCKTSPGQKCSKDMWS